MQNNDRLNKMYRGLNADQWASLAFHYRTDKNDLELSRLTDAVPRKLYSCPDIDFTSRLDAIWRLATWWSVEHWHWRARKAELLGAAIVSIHRSEHERAEDYLDAHGQAEGCLLALDEVLVQICLDRGIDPNDVRKLSGIECYKTPRASATADAEYKTALLSRIPKILDR